MTNRTHTRTRPGPEILALLTHHTPVDHLTPTQLRAALTAARVEIAAHVLKWDEILDSFDDVRCTPGCLGSRLIAPCEECAVDGTADVHAIPKAPDGAEELTRLRAERDAARRVLAELRARVDDAGSLMATSHVRGALDGGRDPRFADPAPCPDLGPCPLPECGSSDTETVDQPVPDTDDTVDCVRCRDCRHTWALDSAADPACGTCGGSGVPGGARYGGIPKCPCTTR